MHNKNREAQTRQLKQRTVMMRDFSAGRQKGGGE
jgi:hypothetical protein